MSGDPLRFPLGRRVLQRGMQTSRSKTRKSCQRNIRSVRGSPTATIQRLLAYSVHEFRFSLSELPSYQVGFHLRRSGTTNTFSSTSILSTSSSQILIISLADFGSEEFAATRESRSDKFRRYGMTPIVICRLPGDAALRLSVQE